jgi:phospholipase C
MTGRRGAGRWATVVLLLGVLVPLLAAAPAHAAEGRPAPNTPIEHFVFLMQENHSFDNYFGTRPGVDGFPEGLCMPRDPGQPDGDCVEPFPIGDRGITDLDHTEDAFEEQYNNGRMDGFVWANEQRGHDGALAMGYYDDKDLPYYWNVADEYVLFDRFFTSAKGGSVRNHMYRVAAQPGATGRSESIPREGWGDIPTIFDRLQEAGVDWKFYVQNYDPQITFRTREAQESGDRAAQVIWVPLLAYARYLDDPELNSRIVDLDQYYEDAATGNLPAVAYIAPSGNSEHPPGSVRAGQRLVRGLIDSLMRSPQWDRSAFLWSYDDWGGWYDHVEPPQVDEYGYGFRAPTLLVSPYARRGFVDSTTYDFTSVLRFIEDNWDLEPLAERDRAATPITAAFDFEQPPREPVLLGTARNVVVPQRPDARPVYGLYAAALLGVLGLMGLAGMLGRERRPGELEPEPAMPEPEPVP